MLQVEGENCPGEEDNLESPGYQDHDPLAPM